METYLTCSRRLARTGSVFFLIACALLALPGAASAQFMFYNDSTGRIQIDNDIQTYSIYASGAVNATGNVIAYGIQGNGNVGGTGAASWHPSGIYSAGHNWLYGGVSLNGGTVDSAGDILSTTNYGLGLVGVYSDVRYQNVWAMGTSWRLAADGTTTGNLYGLAWTHSNIGGQSKAGLSHQLLVMEAGVTKVALGSGIWSRDNIYASMGNATGGGIILSDDGDIVDMNDGWATHRFSYGLRLTNGNKGGGTVIQLANGNSGNTFFNGANFGIGADPGGYKFYVTDQGKDVMFDVNNVLVQNPEATGNTVRLGSAWNKPGVYSNGDLFLGSESRIIINDNNQENWYFDGDNFYSNGWGHIYSNSSNLHLDSYSGEMYLNYYYNNWVTIGDRNTGYLYIGDTRLYDDNDWFRIYSGANNRIYTTSYFRIDNTLEVNGNITAPSASLGNISFKKLYPTTGDSPNSYDHYAIYEQPGSWTHPYPDLMIEYHTGISYVAYYGYGGHRFYGGYSGDASPTTLDFSVAEFDHNVRVYNNIWIGSAGRWATDFATHRGEGTNFIDYSWAMYDAYRGGWRTSNDLYVSNAYRVEGYGAVDAHVGTGMRPFYNWGGSNCTGLPAANYPPYSYCYSTGINVGSHPGDQSYGFEIAMNMWSNQLYSRGYDGGYQAWRPILHKVITTLSCQGGYTNCAPPPCPEGSSETSYVCQGNYSCYRFCCFGQ